MNSASGDLADKLLEAACLGDIEAVRKYVSSGVSINTQNKMNGWSGLHWAAKRGHTNIVTFLLQNGADKSLKTRKEELAFQLTDDAELRKILGGGGDTMTVKDNLPILPNYLANPALPLLETSNSLPNSDYCVENPASLAMNMSTVSSGHHRTPSNQQPDELVLKVRIANAPETDYIEIEIPRTNLTYAVLVSTMCQELQVNPEFVQKVRKLPNTIVRKDKDVARLHDFQEMELVLANKALNLMTQNSRVYAPPAQKHIDVVY